jgi:STAS domain
VGEPGETPTTVLLVADDGTEVVVDRVDTRRPDLGLVDFLAGMQLSARRRGWRVAVRAPSRELEGLLELVGLAGELGLEARREPELREALGIEEVAEPGDPPA